MALIGIFHAILTAVGQVFATLNAHGIGLSAFGHIINIFFALIGWILAGITPTILIAMLIIMMLALI